MDIDKQVEYWREGSREDLQAARLLVDGGKDRHGLFFAHLALEKLIKAHVCRKTRTIAPRIHNLVRLVEMTELAPNPCQRDILADMNAFSIEGRYPGLSLEALSPEEAASYLARAEEAYGWLMRELL